MFRLLRLINRNRILNTSRFYKYVIPSYNVRRFTTLDGELGKESDKEATKDNIDDQNVVNEDLINDQEDKTIDYVQVIDELNQKVDVLEKKLKEVELKYKLSLENNDHLCKIYKKEIENVKQYAITDFAKNMLDVADTFELAFKHMNLENNDEPINEFVNGIKLTENMLHNTFDKFGIKNMIV